MTLALTWLGLMLLLAAEIFGAVTHRGWLAWAAAPVMIALVATVFMHVTKASAIARIFALAGVFWMVVLLGLGSVDFFARRDYPAPQLTRE